MFRPAGCKKNLTNAVLADDWRTPYRLPKLPASSDSDWNPGDSNGHQRPHVSAADDKGLETGWYAMNARAGDSYDGFLDDFLQQLAAETGMLEASVAQDDRRGVGDLTYQAWSLSLSESALRTSTLAEAWQAGATAMFQALVERGYIVPHAVERALASTDDVLTM